MDSTIREFLRLETKEVKLKYEKILQEIICDITKYTLIYYPQIKTGSYPDELYGLAAALRCVNSKRDYPDIVISNFNILWDNEKYKELLDYLINTYIKGEKTT